MKIVDSLETICSEKRTAVAIGKFDGVHAGHRRLLGVIEAAKADGLTPCAFTFDPSPERFFGGEGVKLLSEKDEKRELLEALGVELLVEYPLNAETAAIDPALFIEEFLCKRLRAGLVAAGSDLSFGAGGKGSFALLNAMRRSGGYETAEVEKLTVDGSAVSSSRIRALIAEGRMEDANRCLGRAYSLRGKVIHGARIGHEIGFPTLNLEPPAEKLLPPFGVYRTKICLGGKSYAGLTNIGVKPTVRENAAVTAETYVYDFDEDAYGEEIRVELLSFARPERRFDSLESLKAQLAADIEENRP
ncbi:MAG: riboflavin biosynthesis protein RibF [Lachnospiraceae bacterium]|nr:riboflavin biosynthesis protein RibF [Lachnospiraceae bacterium]